MSREWKPGDVAMVECGDGEWRQATRRETLHGSSWQFADNLLRDCDQSNARPLVVIDPENQKHIEALLREVRGADAASNTNAYLLAQALRDYLPTRDDPQPEPTDPAVRVRDKHDREWALVGDVWCNAWGHVYEWPKLVDLHAPLEVITVTIPPVPDAEPEARPFKVGDRVRVAVDAKSPNGGRHAFAGLTVTLAAFEDIEGHRGWTSEVMLDGPRRWENAWGLLDVDLTHAADADPA